MFCSILYPLPGVLIWMSYQIALTHLVTASEKFHSDMLMKIMRSPMSFFDTVPTGRILNR